MKINRVRKGVLKNGMNGLATLSGGLFVIVDVQHVWYVDTYHMIFLLNVRDHSPSSESSVYNLLNGKSESKYFVIFITKNISLQTGRCCWEREESVFIFHIGEFSYLYIQFNQL
jgi:hypothetical protein